MSICVWCPATQVSADLVNPEVPAWRGDAGTQYYAWDSFTAAYNAPNFNDSGDAGGMLFNFAQGAILTGSGNIYNQGGGLEIHVYGYGSLEQAVFNVASMGTEMEYANVSLGSATAQPARCLRTIRFQRTTLKKSQGLVQMLVPRIHGIYLATPEQ